MHSQALDLLVNTLGDYEEAEKYCAEQARRTRFSSSSSSSVSQLDNEAEEEGAQLLIRLLQIYLAHGSTTTPSSLPAPALRLLNTYPTLLHPSSVRRCIFFLILASTCSSSSLHAIRRSCHCSQRRFLCTPCLITSPRSASCSPPSHPTI